MNNFDNNWRQNYSYGNFQSQFNSNIIYVTSPEEALMRTTGRNCDMVYFHQDKPIFYRVKVDSDGRKVWKDFPYTIPTTEDIHITKADVKDLYERLSRVEKMVSKEEFNDAQSNG